MYKGLSAEEVLCAKGYFAETVFGTSMYPLLREYRDTVVIEKLTTPLKKYDVVLFRRGKQLVLHRIVKVKEGRFLICGDNCIQGEVVYSDQIIGIMTHFCRNEKSYSVGNKPYQLYSRIWVHLLFFRVIYKKTISLIKRMFRRHNARV